MHKTLNRIPVPDSYLLAIGHFVSQWAEFEADMNDTLTVLNQTPDPIPAPFKMRKEALRSLLIQYVSDPKARKELSDILNKACDLGTKRDAVCHGKWLNKPSGPRLCVKNFRPKIAMTSYPWNAEQIERFACRTGDLIRRYRLLDTQHISPGYVASLRKS